MTDPVVIAAYAAAVVAILGALTKVIVELKKNTKTTEATREMVNSAHDANIVRMDQLERGMTDSGIAIPADPAVAAAQRRVEKHNQRLTG
jgi:hypothetical protein